MELKVPRSPVAQYLATIRALQEIIILQSNQLLDSFCLLLVEVLHGHKVLENEEYRK